MKNEEFNDFKDALNSHLTKINVSLGVLSTHVEHLTNEQKAMKAQLQPITHSFGVFKYVAKGVAFCGILVGALLGIIQLIHLVKP